MLDVWNSLFTKKFDNNASDNLCDGGSKRTMSVGSHPLTLLVVFTLTPDIAVSSAFFFVHSQGKDI